MRGAPGNGRPYRDRRSFAESFDFGTWGTICSADYASFFADAVDVIDSACEIFDPEG